MLALERGEQASARLAVGRAVVDGDVDPHPRTDAHQPVERDRPVRDAAGGDHGDLRPRHDRGEEVDGMGAEVRERARAAGELVAVERALARRLDETAALARDVGERE